MFFRWGTNKHFRKREDEIDKLMRKKVNDDVEDGQAGKQKIPIRKNDLQSI